MTADAETTVAIEKSFEDYIASGDETTRQLLEENGPLIQALKTYYDYFATAMWADPRTPLSPMPSLLAFNAFMLFLSGVRVAMTGHAAATFPLLRTALESACYAFLMVDDPGLDTVWINREKGPAEAKACRAAFTPAVRTATAKINAIQEGSADWILEGYDEAIAFGGHPNMRGVIPHISLTEGEEAHVITITALYGATHHRTTQALVACLDFGLAIAVVLMRCLEDPSDEIRRQLPALIDLKDNVVADLNAETEASNSRQDAPHSDAGDDED